MNRKIHVPDGMRIDSERNVSFPNHDWKSGFCAGQNHACWSFSEHPIVPTEEEANLEICRAMEFRPHLDGNGKIIGAKPNDDFISGFMIGAEWVQRRMFLEPEPEVPKCGEPEIFSNRFGTTKAVVCSCGFATTYTVLGNNADDNGLAHFRRMHEVYRLGQKSKMENSK